MGKKGKIPRVMKEFPEVEAILENCYDQTIKLFKIKIGRRRGKKTCDQ